MSTGPAEGPPGAGPQHGWVWAVLPADCRRAEAYGEAGLAEALRAAGVPEVVEAGDGPAQGDADAVLVERGREPAGDLAAASGRLRPGGVVAVALGEGRRPTGGRPARALRRLSEPLRLLAEVRDWERRLGAGGLVTSRIATGERWRAHGLGGRRFLPPGAIVAGSRGVPRRSVLDLAVAEASSALGETSRVGATVRGSGAIVVELRAPAGESYLLRLLAGAAAPLHDLARRNQRRLAAEAPGPVSERLVAPVGEGDVGLAAYEVEPKVEGAAPRRLGEALWGDCLEFLVALRSTPGAAGEPIGGLRSAADALRAHLDAPERQTLERTMLSLGERLGHVPGGWAHGDFWPGNLIARDGRMVAVIDWDAAAPGQLPLLDLFHLVCMAPGRLRRLSHGRRCTSVLWPLVRAGGDKRIRDYCAATGTPADPTTLEALATAYWIARVGRDLRTFSDRARRGRWMEENVRRPLAALAGN